MNKTKILILTPRLPYPPIGGDRLRAYWILNILCKHFDVHLVSISEKEPEKNFHKWATSLNIRYKLFKKTKKEYYLSSLRSLYNNLPLQVNYFYFEDVQEYVDRVYKSFDILFASLIRTAEYIIDKQKPKILDMTDSIALNYLRSKEKTTSLKWKLLYNFEYNRLLNYEKRCIEMFDNVLFVNENERLYYQNNLKTSLITNGVNPKLFNYNSYDSNYKNAVVFFGKMDYQPNIDAVLWFVENVLPLLDRDVKFYIVGANPTRVIKNLQKKHKNLVVTGFLEDPYLIIKSSLCVVSPMQTGAGIQNKILESMALGTINIVSSLSVQPIGGEHMKHYIVCDNPSTIAETILDIKINPSKYEHIKVYAKEFIKENFNWDIIEQKLVNVIYEVLNKT